MASTFVALAEAFWPEGMGMSAYLLQFGLASCTDRRIMRHLMFLAVLGDDGQAIALLVRRGAS